MTGVRIQGLRKVVRSLERYGVEASDLKQAFQRIGNLVKAEAQSLAPKRSGALEASIRPSKAKSKAIIRAGSTKVPYAGVVHYGGGVGPGRRGPHNIQPHPFLTDAIEAKQDDAVDLLERDLNRLIRKLGLN